MVYCAFAFCWWESSDFLEVETSPGVTLQAKESDPASETRMLPEGGKKKRHPTQASGPLVADGAQERAWLEPNVMLMRYWRAFSDLPPPKELKALLERAFSGKGLYLYAR
jgi:hypothetical protein